METINLKSLIRCILRVCPRCPISYLSENELLFRGLLIHLEQGKAKTKDWEFKYNSINSFIDGLRYYGLMISFAEIEAINKFYNSGTGKTQNYEG